MRAPVLAEQLRPTFQPVLPHLKQEEVANLLIVMQAEHAIPKAGGQLAQVHKEVAVFAED